MKIKELSISSVCLLLPNIIFAEGLLGVQGMKIGAGKLYPDITVTTFYDDNLTRASTGEISTFGILVVPHLAYEIKNNKKLYFADYEFTTAFHENSSDDDYTANRVQVGYEYTPTKRIFAGIRGEYLDAIDPRGTGAAEGTGIVPTEPDEWHHYQVEGNLGYGGKKAKGRAEVDLGYVSKKYDNNRSQTFVRDRDDASATGRFYYRIMPKTSLLLEGRYTNTNYDNEQAGVASLDSSTSEILLGVTWRSTFKTTGTAQFGYIDKDFDSDAQPDGDAFAWEVGVEWRPKSFSIFNFNTSRDFDETNGAGNFIETDSIDASWTHQWHKFSPRLSTVVDFSYSEQSFGTITREDDYLNLGISINYKMRRWLQLGGGYRYDERDSTDNDFDYDRNLVELFANIAL